MPILCLFSCDINALSATIRKSLTNNSGAITQFEPTLLSATFLPTSALVSGSSVNRQRDWTASGSIDCCIAKESRAMWSIRLRSRPRADGGEPRPTARLWFARFWHINAANREYFGTRARSQFSGDQWADCVSLSPPPLPDITASIKRPSPSQTPAASPSSCRFSKLLISNVCYNRRARPKRQASHEIAH